MKPQNTEARSRIMRAVRSKNTKPEIVIRKYLFSEGYRYRLHYKGLPGKPDIVLPKFKKIILVNGCFWHQHQRKSCRASLPASNLSYWVPKLKRNKLRDTENLLSLRKLKWDVLVIWECDLRQSEQRIFKRIKKFMDK